VPDQVTVQDITCPANTPVDAPVEVPLDDFGGNLVTIRLVIPDGHAGLTGISFGYGHNPVIPLNAGAFISGNDEPMKFDLRGYPDGVGWSAFVCNLDTQPHTWQVRCEWNDLVSAPAQVSSTPIAPADINAAAAALNGA
jgi:hypothetical protein